MYTSGTKKCLCDKMKLVLKLELKIKTRFNLD